MFSGGSHSLRSGNVSGEPLSETFVKDMVQPQVFIKKIFSQGFTGKVAMQFRKLVAACLKS